VILINLLPHREETRKRKKIAFLVGLGRRGSGGLGDRRWLVCHRGPAQGGAAGAQSVPSAEIAKLDKEIKDIATLKAEIASLVARQKAVEDLQIDRNLPVHILNELVKQTPEGMYFTLVKQDGQVLTVSGIAQTQERVSEFLRNTAYNSEWLVSPELVESKAATLTAANKEQKRLFDFSVRLTVKRRRTKFPAAADGASAPRAPAGRASAPVPKKAA
jgi:type IV pilus assembly protein PilN